MSSYERQIVVAEIDTLGADLCAAYETLPPCAQAKALRLANSLSALRKHFARADGGRDAVTFAKGTDVAASTVANAASTRDTNTALRSPSPNSSTKSAAHIPASPATTMQRRSVSTRPPANLPAPASLTGAEIFHMEQK